jgi:hypothetical protein
MELYKVLKRPSLNIYSTKSLYLRKTASSDNGRLIISTYRFQEAEVALDNGRRLLQLSHHENISGFLRLPLHFLLQLNPQPINRKK